MAVKKTWLSFMTTAVVIGVPMLAAAQLPNPIQTPGAKGKANQERVCAEGFEASAEPIAKWQRDQALERYGRRSSEFTGELDHLIPVSLGGTNDPDNLWPLPSNKDMGPAEKKALEEKLHQMVCANSMSLKAAQDAIKKNWVKAFNEYVKGGAINTK